MPQPIGGREPLQDYLRVQALTEKELVAQLEAASRDIQRLIVQAEARGSFSGGVRASQYRLVLQEIRELQQALWADGIQTTITWGKRRAVDAAADSMARLTEVYRAAMGDAGLSAADWQASQRATARSGLTNVLSRSVNNIKLSERVYKQSALATGKVDRIINTGIIGGQSAREIAQNVRGFISPSTPGGASYAAMRLGRTELNNAFHTTTVKTWGASPFVKAFRWNLSGSHPKPDECDDIAANSPYSQAQVPGKPHPQCLCYLTPEVEDEDDFVRNFHAGQYDEYLDSRVAAAERAYPESDRERAMALTQRRVYVQGQGPIQITELPPRQQGRFLTAEERGLLRAQGFSG